MRHILSLALMLVTALTINAQINTHIWGLTIGKSTKQQVKNVLLQKGYRYEKVNNKTNVQAYCISPKDGIYFGGSNWEYVFFNFYKNILYCIGFQNEKYNSAVDIYSTFDLLKNRLNQKYSSYITNSDYYEIDYNDGETWIWLSIYDDDSSYDNKFISLEYTNYKIFKIIYNEENDEL